MQLVRVRWDIEQRGAPLVYAEGGGVWVVSLGGEVSFPAPGSIVSNVFRLDPEALTAERLPIGRVVDAVFPDEGLLWFLRLGLPDHRLMLFSLGPGASLDAKDTDGCPWDLGSRSVAYTGRLWLDCGNRVLVFDLAHAAPVAEHRVPRLAALLGSRIGLWAANDRELECLDGACSGRTIRLPHGFLAEADYATVPGWDVDGDEAWAQGLLGDGYALVRVDLRTGAVQTSPIPRPEVIYADIAVVGDEVWIADTSAWSILRFRRSIAARPLGRLRLPARLQRDDDRVGITLDRGGGWVWITSWGNSEVRFYRAPIPRA